MYILSQITELLKTFPNVHLVCLNDSDSIYFYQKPKIIQSYWRISSTYHLVGLHRVFHFPTVWYHMAAIWCYNNKLKKCSSLHCHQVVALLRVCKPRQHKLINALHVCYLHPHLYGSQYLAKLLANITQTAINITFTIIHISEIIRKRNSFWRDERDWAYSRSSISQNLILICSFIGWNSFCKWVGVNLITKSVSNWRYF